MELFFDLVFVFAFTQVSLLLEETPTWIGLLQGTLILGALWWAWNGYAWLTNTLDPERGVVRLTMFLAAAAALVASLAVPNAFGETGLVFGVAFLILRLQSLTLLAISGRGDHDFFRAIMRTLPGSIIAPGCIIAAAFVEGPAQLILWGLALAVFYGGALVGHMRGWQVSPDHLVERFGLIIIIALGESILGIGIGAAGLPLDAALVVAGLLGFTIAACLWWSYFDWVIFIEQASLTDEVGSKRAELARDLYSYLHLPMVAGIVLFAFGIRFAMVNLADPLSLVPAFGLCGGVALYMAAHVALRIRVGSGIARGRTVATILLAILVSVATLMPALAALGSVALVCVLLIIYEYVRHRDDRARIRSQQGSLSQRDLMTRSRAGDLPSRKPEN